MTNEKKQEFTLRISQANKTQLIVILYEMLLQYVKDAKAAHAEENRTVFRENIKWARGCVNELMQSLNFEMELAHILLQLYIYVNKELAGADVRNKVEPLENVTVVICSLHETYMKLAAQDKSAPVMDNTQTIYAGLTYGKNDITENLSDQGTNRGFLA